MKKIENYNINRIEEKDQKYKISVCVAVYNSEAYLERCILSIIRQTYKNLEIILVDDGSTDSCGSICDRFAEIDNRIVVIHKKNGGLFSTRNVGIEAATGDFICFLDGDDYIDPTMYESMLSTLLTENAELVVCRYKQIFEDETVDKSTNSIIIYEGTEILEQFLKEDEAILIQNAAWNKLYKRSLLKELRFPSRWYEDMLFTPQLLTLSKRSVYMDTAFHNYICDRSDSIMNKGVNNKIFTDLIPNLFDRSAYLEAIGRHDLALISDYFLYKKLLGFVTMVNRSNSPDKKQQLGMLDECIKQGAPKIDEIFSISIANPNELKKLKIYLASPVLYRASMLINDKTIIPVKQRIYKYVHNTK